MKKKILKTVMVLSVILVFSASVLAYIENPRKKCWKPFDKLEVGTLDPQGQSNNLQSGGSLDKTPPIIDQDGTSKITGNEMPLVIIATITHNNELGSHPTKTNKYSTTVYAECSPDQLEFPYEPSLVERLNAFLVVAADASSNISQVVIGGRIINPSGSTGDWAILLYVNCLGGVTCNQTGKIIATVKECGSDGRILASETSRQGVTLTESSPLKLKIQNLPVGNFCVDAFLDVNSNGIRNTGDIVAASGEIPIKLDHRVESVTINLDTVFP